MWVVSSVRSPHGLRARRSEDGWDNVWTILILSPVLFCFPSDLRVLKLIPVVSSPPPDWVGSRISLRIHLLQDDWSQ